MDKVLQLKQWMYNQKVTAAELARRAGCTPPVFSYILNGKRPLSEDMERRLKKAGVNL
jgi:transcriptional regulator with XRE-family HTH domain